MRRLIMLVPTVAMLCCLGAYAIGGVVLPKSPSRAAAPVEKADSGEQLRPLRAMSAGELSARDAESLQRRRQAVDEATRQREAQVIAMLGLNSEQQSRYDSLVAKMSAESVHMMAQPTGHVARGMAINQMLHQGLRDIFTPEQYQRYLKLWSDKRDVYGAVEPTSSEPDPSADSSPDPNSAKDVSP